MNIQNQMTMLKMKTQNNIKSRTTWLLALPSTVPFAGHSEEASPSPGRAISRERREQRRQMALGKFLKAHGFAGPKEPKKHGNQDRRFGMVLEHDKSRV